MYQVSNSFLQAMDDISRTLAVEVEISGVRYPTDAIIRFELERGVFDNDTFTIGQTMSNALTLEIFTTPTIQTGDEIKLFTSLRVGEKDERVPLGVYYVDSATVNKEKMTLTCYDKMVTLIDEYIPSANHTTLAALFEDVLSQIGMTYDGVFHDAPIKAPLYGYTYRETLGFIASLNGGNMSINRAGHLEIQRFQTVERAIPAKACFSFEVKDVYRVSKVFCQFGDVGIARGDSSGQCVAFENPYVTEQNIDTIYNQLNGLSFTAATLNYRGDLTLDPGDIFQFTDYKGDIYPLMCGRNKLTFNGGLSGQLDSIGESETTNSYAESQLKYKKNITKLTAELGKIQGVVQEIEQSHDGLEERVKKAELEITADAIKSKVENHFVAKDEINGLVTNEQLQSAITQSANSITAQVSTKYETKANVETKISDAIGDVQVGGTNLWVISDLVDGWESGGVIVGEGSQHKTRQTLIPTNGARQLVYQCWNPNRIVNTENANRVAYFDTNRNYITWDGVAQLSGDTYQYQLMDIPENAVYMRLGAICGVNGGSYESSIKIKFELGNKATDWTPAPEDVDSNIQSAKQDAINSANNTLTNTIANYYTREETNSQINVAKDAINLGVSQTYETKANVETKVTNAIAESKILPDTRDTNENPHWYMINYPRQTITEFKRAETIGIPNSWDNYGTLQTIVPWNDNSGGLPVQTFRSNFYKTYERKGISDEAWGEWAQIEDTIGSQAKADTAYNNAVTTTNNTLTTTIANYYTKEETNSQINIAKDEINLGVSQTYETKATVTTKVNNAVNNIQVGGTNLWVLSDIVTGWESDGAIIGEGDAHKTRQSLIPTNGAKELVYQCWNPNRLVNASNSNRVAFFDGDRNYVTSRGVVMLSGEEYQQQLIDIPSNTSYMRLGAICGVSSYDGSIKIKFELGNKATDFSPAPEDTESDITILESETKTLKESVTSLQLGTDSINASVKSLQETVTNTANSLAQDIQSVQNQVNLAMTSDDVKIEIQKEMSKGTNKVSTSTGFTFDDNGLKVSKSDSEMSTQITEDGMKVYRNNEVVLTANNQGVDAKNLHATTYLIIGNNSRMEDFSEDGVKRTAMFWIGE